MSDSLLPAADASETDLREGVCEVGRRVYARGFAAANDGNISVRLAEADRFLCTPTGVSKGYLRPDRLCTVDGSGDLVEGPPRTSEILLHTAIFGARPDVNAVVHCHAPHATAFALTHTELPQNLVPEVEFFLGPVPMTPYETPGTQAFADTILPVVAGANTVLLANHGVVAFGATLQDAWYQTEIVDSYCRLLMLARQLGTPQPLPDGKLAELLAMKRHAGIADPRHNDVS